MAKSTILLILMVLVGSNFCYGQDLEALEKKLNGFGAQKNTQSSFKRNAFLDFKLAAGTEFMLLSRNEFSLINDELDTFYRTERPFLTTIASFAIEPRLNLTHLKNRKVLFIKSPTGLGLSITSRTTYIRRYGVFHFNTGLLIGIGSGFHSSKLNVEKNGFAVSLGFQYLRAPMTGHTIREEYEYLGVDTFHDTYKLLDEPRKNWLLPTIQVDLYYLNKHNKPRGYSLTVSAYRSIYFKFAKTILDKAN